MHSAAEEHIHNERNDELIRGPNLGVAALVAALQIEHQYGMIAERRRKQPHAVGTGLGEIRRFEVDSRGGGRGLEGKRHVAVRGGWRFCCLELFRDRGDH